MGFFLNRSICWVKVLVIKFWFFCKVDVFKFFPIENCFIVWSPGVDGVAEFMMEKKVISFRFDSLRYSGVISKE